ncbi:TPA: hypothetical protein QCZ12_003123 [Bacillus cereus]|nr:hypothetical protein [Bacillus cereus]
MRAKEILTKLGTLEQKRDEVSSALIETSYREAKLVLEDSLKKYQKKVDAFLNTEFEPLSSTAFLMVSHKHLNLNTGDQVQLNVEVLTSDGITKNVTAELRPAMLFKDIDNLYNNKGLITAVDISNYKFEERTVEIVKTTNGFGVGDDRETQGLQVIATNKRNEYRIVNLKGDYLGVTFQTDGKEEVGDNWLIYVYWASTGTTYSVKDKYIAKVSPEGIVTGLSGGTTDIVITNGVHEVFVPITVVGNEAPEPPAITSVDNMESGVEVRFDYSTSPDSESYNIFVNDVLVLTGVEHSPAKLDHNIFNDKVSVIEMTAINLEGKESEKSNAFQYKPSDELPTT